MANSETRTGESDGRTAPARRVLIIGLDGATFDVLDPLIAEGRLPHLAAVVRDGASGILRSTVPPITPAAWTTFLTGKLPGAHGIIDFERYDVHAHRLGFNSTRCLDHVRNLWQILGDHRLKVGSVNVPMTYPPMPVNGFLVSGFETPGPEAEFVYPPAMRDEILRRWPDPTLKASWKRKTFGGIRVFQRNLDYVSRSFHQGADMSMFLGERFGWDALMVVFKLTDNLQHKTWKYIDPRWASRQPRRTELVKQCFVEVDRAVGTLLDYARAHEAAVLIVSDHGHGSLEGKIHPNLLLQRWGYLALHGGAAQEATRARFLWDRWRGRTKRFARAGDVAHDLAVDFTRTRACVMHAGMAGFLYVNLAGRQPCGIVSPTEYESFRDELKTRFLGDDCLVHDPSGRRVRLFAEVHKPEALYGCSREDQPWMPDLILTPHDSLAVVRNIRGHQPVRWLSDRRIEGTHRPEGILMAAGPGVRRGCKVSANIVDCAPTILTLLGLPVPNDMQGCVIQDLFASPPTVQFAEAVSSARGDDDQPVYSEQELQKVTDRLSDLGYLE